MDTSVSILPKEVTKWCTDCKNENLDRICNKCLDITFETKEQNERKPFWQPK